MYSFKIALWGLVFLISTQSWAQNKDLSSNNKILHILYTNDLHSHIEPLKVAHISTTRLLGGFANIATIVKNEKKANPENTVYFDAGDYFCGPYISSLTKGEAVIDILNYMDIDAVTIGNHEFDYGWQNAYEQLSKAKFPILNGNIFLKGTENLFWNNPYQIMKVNDVRLGIIGLHGKFAFYDTTAEEMVQGIEAKDEVYYLKKYIDELEGKTDLIILLAHQGIPGRQSSTGSDDVARNLQTDIDLAKEVPGIDIIITGHAHQGTPEPLISNGTLIVSTDALGIEVGKLTVAYDPDSDKIVHYINQLDHLYDDEVEDDTTVQRVILEWKNRIKSVTDVQVCIASEPLTRSYSEESFLGNITADAMMNAFTGFDMALTNSGGLRQDIEAGSVTIGSIISAFPFPNTIVQLELSGSDLLSILEHGAGLTNGIMQVSKSVKMTYDEQKPVGSRLVSCQINGSHLDIDKTYKVLTSNFIADGGDGFSNFKNGKNVKRTTIEVLSAMVNYLKGFDIYTPVLEGRITKL